MYKKTLIGLIMVLGVIVLGVAAFAHGPGYGSGGGHMMGYRSGGGHMMDYGVNGAYNEKTAEIQRELYQKQLELNDILSAPEIDEAKAKSLNAEINKLRNELSEANLAGNLESRKNNPGFRGGYGYGHGYGHGYHW